MARFAQIYLLMLSSKKKIFFFASVKKKKYFWSRARLSLVAMAHDFQIRKSWDEKKKSHPRLGTVWCYIVISRATHTRATLAGSFDLQDPTARQSNTTRREPPSSPFSVCCCCCGPLLLSCLPLRRRNCLLLLPHRNFHLSTRGGCAAAATATRARHRYIGRWKLMTTGNVTLVTWPFCFVCVTLLLLLLFLIVLVDKKDFFLFFFF